MNVTTAVKAYAKVGVESGVISADPHKLILMLFQGALLATSMAKNQILRKEISAKGKSISQAISIIDDGLKACLDKKVGGELAQNLASLYDYMVSRLLAANLKNDVILLDEVIGLLKELMGAWEQIRPGTKAAQAEEPLSASQPDSAPMANVNIPKSAIGKQATLMYGKV